MPFSYVWGPAGSGKSRVVLFSALNYYVKNNQKVILLAPTNNALEQALKVLMERFLEVGIRLSAVLRLGMPSQNFLESYPPCCDPSLFIERRESYKQRLEESRVIATTLDTFIKRKELLDLNFAHIFVDECAFASLIKILPLCTLNKPITLLGDHKQLPPVCSISAYDLKKPFYKECQLWQKSSLLIETFLQEGIGFLDSTHKELPLDEKQVLILTHTYRYGNNLTHILDKFIYRFGLHGTPKQTRILYLDTHLATTIPKDYPELKLSNPKEAFMCAKLTQTNLLQNSDYAIITPFVNQRKLILHFSRTIPPSRTLTIHSSQGQEFDTIVLSPTELHYHLSDSRNQKALYALNVALSRAKTQIIIVCDYHYWMQYPQQFLTQILKIATPIEIKAPMQQLPNSK